MRVRLWWAAALAVVGLLWLLVEAQSPSVLQWTGDEVAAYAQRGIVYYSYHGQDDTLIDPDQAASDDTRAPRTVFVDPADPTHAQLYSATRWLDASLVLVWFAAAAVLVVLALRRRRRRAAPL